MLIGRLIALLGAIVLISVVSLSPLRAQSTDGTGGTRAAEINAIADKLTDDQSAALIRMMELLADENKAAAKSDQRSIGFTEIIQNSARSFSHKTQYHISRIPKLLAEIGQAIASVLTIQFLSAFALMLAAGTATNYFTRWLARDARERIETHRSEVLQEQLRTLSTRLVLGLLGLIGFVIVAAVMAHVVVDDPRDQSILISFILTVVTIPWLTSAILQYVLGPDRPDLRLVTADDSTARFIHRSLVTLAVFIGFSFFVLGLFGRYEIPIEDSLRFWVGFVAVLWFACLTWFARRGLTSIIKGKDELLTAGLERMASWWPTVSIVVLIFVWLYNQFVIVQEFSPVRGAIALAVIVTAPFFDTALRGIIRHALPPMEGEGAVAEKAHLQTRLSYIRISRVLLFATIILVLGRLLGISFQDMAEAGLGAQIAANGVQAILVLAAGYIAWETVNVWANRQLARETPSDESTSESGAEDGGQSKSRIASVLPLIQKSLLIAIGVLTVLLALSQLGFDITPLLAGAGVLGLAIGFGAQTLVKDVVSGVFFLLDDAFRVGEFLEIGATSGAVEKISVRSLQLRGVNGPVHIVPYGTISQLTNHSRDWVIMKLGFTVPFDTNIDKVRKLFKKIGQEIMEYPELAKDIIEPFKSQGVTAVDDVGMVIRGKFMSKPGKQWVLRKEIYTRVQKAFEENGIEFARKEVRVKLSDDQGGAALTDDQKETVAAAAVEAAEPKSA
ncbi:MAG: mechanosensitive ion channel family protein [Rhizobiaceae bacterium]